MLRLLFSVLVIFFSQTSLAEPPTLAESHLKTAKAALKKRNYEIVIEELKQAENTLQSSDSLKTRVSIEMTYGLMMLNTRRRLQAAEHYEKAFLLAQQGGHVRWQVKAITSLAQTQPYDKAMTWLNTAEKIAQDKPFLAAEVLATRSLISTWNGHHSDAIASGKAALSVLEKDKKHSKMALAARSSVAYGLMQTKQLDQALETYDQVIQSAFEIQHWQSIHRAYCSRADILMQQGRYQHAEDDLWRAIQGLEQERSTIPWTEQTRASFMEDQILAYDNMVMLMADTDRLQQALEMAERYYAKHFINLFDRQAVNEIFGLESSLLDQQKDLLHQLNQLRINGAATAEQKNVEEELRTLQSSIEKTHPKYHELTNQKPAKLEQIQQQLASDQAMLIYWVHKDRTLIWYVDQEQLVMRQIPVSEAKLQTEIKAWLKPIEHPAFADLIKLKRQEQQHSQHAQSLYQWLLGSVVTLTKDKHRLIIIPDSQLQKLPFESLIKKCDVQESFSYSSCEFVGLKKAISYNDSMTSWLSLKNRQPQQSEKPQVLAFATNSNDIQNLPAALTELDNIQQQFPQGRYQSGSESTEQLFKSLAGEYQILHLASHGIINNHVPMNSGLQLLKSTEDDGYLSAYEVMTLNLDSRLTTLSACQSGDGHVVRGAGIVGLSQSFLRAGSDAVLVSRWLLQDQAAAEFMKHFYAAFKQEPSKSKALLGRTPKDVYGF